jgi:TrpR family transcriptional regulator, trp operon repressor
MAKKTGDDGWRQFIELCQQTKTKQELNELLRFFLTPSEKEAINYRVELIRELLRGDKSQRIIAGDLKISIAKITRGSNQLKYTGEKLKRFLTKRLC